MYWWFFLILFTVTPTSVSIKDLQGLPLKLLISCIAKLQFLKLYDQLYAANFSRNCLSYQCEILRIDRQVWRWPRLLIYVKNTASACWAQKLGTQILTNFCWFFHILFLWNNLWIHIKQKVCKITKPLQWLQDLRAKKLL